MPDRTYDLFKQQIKSVVNNMVVLNPNQCRVGQDLQSILSSRQGQSLTTCRFESHSVPDGTYSLFSGADKVSHPQCDPFGSHSVLDGTYRLFSAADKVSHQHRSFGVSFHAEQDLQAMFNKQSQSSTTIILNVIQCRTELTNFVSQQNQSSTTLSF